MLCCKTHTRFKPVFGGGAGRYYLICTKCGRVFRAVHESEKRTMSRLRRKYN